RRGAGPARPDVGEAMEARLPFEDPPPLRAPVAAVDGGEEGHGRSARAKPGGVMELSPAAPSLRSRRDFREHDGEGRPFAYLGGDLDGSAMGTHDVLRECEADSGLLLFG